MMAIMRAVSHGPPSGSSATSPQLVRLLLEVILWNQKSTSERRFWPSTLARSSMFAPGVGFSQVPTLGRRGAATRRLFWPSGSTAVMERRGAGFYERRGAGPRRSSGA